MKKRPQKAIICNGRIHSLVHPSTYWDLRWSRKWNNVLVSAIRFWTLVLFTSISLGQTIDLEWEPYASPASITHLDVECSQDIQVVQGVLVNPLVWTAMNAAPIPSTDTTFIAQVPNVGFWICRVIAIGPSSDEIKGIFKLVAVPNPVGMRTP